MKDTNEDKMFRIPEALYMVAGVAVLSVPIILFWHCFYYEPAHRPFRKFVLQSGETIYCRQMQGNAKYGVDFIGCKDGANRYNVPGLILEIKP